MFAHQQHTRRRLQKAKTASIKVAPAKVLRIKKSAAAEAPDANFLTKTDKSYDTENKSGTGSVPPPGKS